MYRIVGTETEFGIISRIPGQADPVSHSIQLIGHSPFLPARQAIWDYENENPFLDARGFTVEGEPERPSPHYNRQLNKLLPNAGRLYVDGAHPEYSTPECSNAWEVVAYERAGERIAAACLEAWNAELGSDAFVVYKNNSDGKGNSYGYHENYLLPRTIPFDHIARVLIPFLVTRQIFAGAGKVGAENQTSPAEYQISQRADFFECLLDLNTMIKRPIINTRDEPHADPTKYRRLHVIVGDANMSEISTYLKVGTMALVMDMIEAQAPLPILELDNPVMAIKQVSRDLHVKTPLKLVDGRSMPAIEIQRLYLRAAQDLYARRDLSPMTKELLVRWETVLEKLERDPLELRTELDWVAKRYVIESYMARKGCGWSDPRVSLMDLQYHDVRPSKGLYFTLERNGQIARLLTDEQIVHAQQTAPANTRAFFRGACLERFAERIYGMSWTSVLFDLGNATIKRIPLLDPHRGTRELTKELLDGVSTPEELVAKIAT
ncbi:MAG: proteasome accessory factor PafA2 [Nitrospirae bacterium]|nr:MAG: proteasome accessory factor PafA2 [Nitrospirota bacterium]